MKKKLISDIRLYKSESQNEYGGYVTDSFADKKLNAMVKRIVMKLREMEFSLGEFDHLYINFTTCNVPGNMCLSDEVDRYHPWYRYCTVAVEKHIYDNLRSPENYDIIIRFISNILFAYFTTVDFDEARILSCVQQANEQGEDMLMKFKEKLSATRKAIIFLRYLDTCRYFPLLRVYDMEDHLLLEKDLPETLTLDYMGEIQISMHRVTIKPRKNAFTSKMVPFIFEY